MILFFFNPSSATAGLTTIANDMCVIGGRHSDTVCCRAHFDEEQRGLCKLARK